MMRVSHYFKSQIGNVRPKRGGAKLHRSICTSQMRCGFA